MSDSTLLQDLKAEVQRGSAVFVAGTGVAVALSGNQEVGGYPVASWAGLIRHGIHWCRSQDFYDTDEADLLESQVNSNKPKFLIRAAEDVSQTLRDRSEGVYRRWLKDTVGSLSAAKPELAKAMAALPGILVTLNYDGMIEQVTGRKPVTWLDQDKIQGILRGEYPESVLHLHGHYDSPESVVLGLETYNRARSDAHTRAVTTAFTIGRTLVFVGCAGPSEDPNFGRLLEWGEEAQKDSPYRHYLLCADDDLDRMRALTKDSPWIFALSYGSDPSKLATFLESLMPQGGSPAIQASPPVPDFNEALYARKLKDRYLRMRLESVEMTGGQYRPLELLRVFVPQSVRECQEYLPQVLELPKEQLERLREHGELDTALADRREEEALRRRYLQQIPREAMALADDPAFPRTVILGDPGSGKSSLLQALVLRWADLPTEARRVARLPVLVELRAFVTAYKQRDRWDILDYIASDPFTVMPIPRDLLEQRLREGRAAILFDGLDEVFDPGLREQISLAVQGLASEYGSTKSRFLLTSRPIGYRGDLFRNDDFRHFMLQDLDAHFQIPTFLRKWHDETYPESERKDAEAKRDRLLNAIQSSSSIRMLAGNPLLLTMMALLNRNQDLPRDRAQLYDQCSRLLLHHWDVDKTLRDADPGLEAGAIGVTEKQDILRRLAREMQGGTGKLGTAISVEQLERVFAETLSQLLGGNGRAMGRALIKQLRERNFILCFLGGDTYGFVHRTFLEYFVALDIKRRFEYDQGPLQIDINYLKNELFLRRWPEETWHEVLRLVASLLNPRVVDEILASLLAVTDLSRKFLPQFLAAQCIQEIRDRRGLKARDLQICSALHNMTTAREYRFNWNYGFWEERLSSVRQTAAQALITGYRDDSGTLQALKDQVAGDVSDPVRQATVHALATAYRHDPDVLVWLKERAQEDHNESVRQTAVMEVSRTYGSDTDTIKWLKDLALSGRSAGLRQAAVRALTGPFYIDPDIRGILFQSAARDPDWTVRQAAIQSLPIAYRNDPETLPLLMDRASADTSVYVRQSAIQALASGYRADADTLIFLRGISESAADAGVRQSAALALAGHPSGEEWIPAWLKERAVQDPAPIVRQSILQSLVNYYRTDADLLHWLMARAVEDPDVQARQAALKGAATAFRSDPTILPWLKDLLQSNADEKNRLMALQTVSELFSADRDLAPLLRERSTADSNWLVRVGALQAAASLFYDDVNTLPWLMDLMLRDDSEQVRAGALLALAARRADDPEIVQKIRECITADEGALVRQAAVRVIADVSPNDKAMLETLKQRLEQDIDVNVRRAALRAVADGYRDDPGTRAWLQEIITGDKDQGNHFAAVQAFAAVYCEDSETLPWLKALAVSSAPDSARSAAVQAIVSSFRGDQATLAWLKELVSDDNNRAAGQAAVHAVASGYHGDLGTEPWLKTVAIGSLNGYVRQAAVQAVTSMFRTDAAMVPWTLEIAASADEWMVRSAAVTALANHFADSAETLTALLKRAADDDNEFVRQTALRGLASSFPRRAETRDMLKERGASDPHWMVRQSAIQALSVTWRDDPGTLEWFREREAADENAIVRQEAGRALRLQ